MKEAIKVSAPAKVHFLGEHFVVYGGPALITTVDRRCKVDLLPRDSSEIKISSRNLDREVVLSVDQVLAKREDSQKKWEAYRDGGDIAVLRAISSDDMDHSIIAIGETLHFFNKRLPSGFSLSIDSEIPVGAALGSSASTAVTIVAAMTSFLGQDFNKNTINDIAFLVEQRKHGLPSGGDNAAVCFGGLIWFRKETPDIKVIQQVPFSVAPSVAKNFVIIDTGRPKESTGEMVGMVRTLRDNNRQMVDKVLYDQERLTRELTVALKSGSEKDIMAIIKAGERNLEAIGVASPSSMRLIREIEDAGGVAKICGAGGKTEATGVVLAYNSDPSIPQKIASSHNLRVYPTVLGVDGLRQE